MVVVAPPQRGRATTEGGPGRTAQKGGVRCRSGGDWGRPRRPSCGLLLSAPCRLGRPWDAPAGLLLGAAPVGGVSWVSRPGAPPPPPGAVAPWRPAGPFFLSAGAVCRLGRPVACALSVLGRSASLWRLLSGRLSSAPDRGVPLLLSWRLAPWWSSSFPGLLGGPSFLLLGCPFLGCPCGRAALRGFWIACLCVPCGRVLRVSFGGPCARPVRLLAGVSGACAPWRLCFCGRSAPLGRSSWRPLRSCPCPLGRSPCGALPVLFLGGVPCGPSSASPSHWVPLACGWAWKGQEDRGGRPLPLIGSLSRAGGHGRARKIGRPRRPLPLIGSLSRAGGHGRARKIGRPRRPLPLIGSLSRAGGHGRARRSGGRDLSFSLGPSRARMSREDRRSGGGGHRGRRGAS